MKICDEGIVIKVVKFNNSSLIGKIFSKNHGLLSLVIKGAGSKNNRAKAILFQSPNIVDFETDLKENREVHFIYEIHPNVFYKNLTFDFKRAGISSFVIEVMNKVCSEDPDEELYDYLKSQLVILDDMSTNLSYYPLIFLKNLTHILGIFPHLESYRKGMFLDLYNGELVDTEPHHHHYRDKGILEVFIKFMRNETTMLNSDERKTILSKLLDYFAIHIPNFGTLNSPKILSIILN